MHKGRIITEDAGSETYKTSSSSLKVSFKIFMKFVCGSTQLKFKNFLFPEFKVVTTKDFGIEVDISAYMFQEFLILKKPKGQMWR